VTAFTVLTRGEQEVPAPLYKPGTKLRHRGDPEQKAKVLYVYPESRTFWDYVLLVKYRNVPAYMNGEDSEHWDHDQMWVWEEDTDEPAGPAAAAA
jgi:hypothetical protein